VRALALGIRRAIFMAYCNALGNFVINVRNGKAGEVSHDRPSAQSASLFHQISSGVHNCFNCFTAHTRGDEKETREIRRCGASRRRQAKRFPSAIAETCYYTSLITR